MEAGGEQAKEAKTDGNIKHVRLRLHEVKFTHINTAPASGFVVLHQLTYLFCDLQDKRQLQQLHKHEASQKRGCRIYIFMLL